MLQKSHRGRLKIASLIPDGMLDCLSITKAGEGKGNIRWVGDGLYICEGCLCGNCIYDAYFFMNFAPYLDYSGKFQCLKICTSMYRPVY